MYKLKVGQDKIGLTQHRPPWFTLDCCSVDNDIIKTRV